MGSCLPEEIRRRRRQVTDLIHVIIACLRASSLSSQGQSSRRSIGCKWRSGSGLLLLLLLVLGNGNLLGLLHHVVEVLLVSEQVLVVDDVLVQEHASHSWRQVRANRLLDDGVNTVTHEALAVVAGLLLEFGQIHLRKGD